VSPNEKPLFLKAEPETQAAPEDCFEIVRRKTCAQGGEPVYGWLIAEIPGVMIEAMFHAVWRDDRGILHDISPQTGVPDNRLFLPDPARTYQGCQVNNIRKALRDDPAIHRFISAMDQRFAVLNSGDRATQHGSISIPQHEILPVQLEMEAAVKALAASLCGRKSIVKVGRNELCPCGSGRKYKRCCAG
jgi:hypothetical protein